MNHLLAVDKADLDSLCNRADHERGLDEYSLCLVSATRTNSAAPADFCSHVDSAVALLPVKYDIEADIAPRKLLDVFNMECTRASTGIDLRAEIVNPPIG